MNKLINLKTFFYVLIAGLVVGSAFFYFINKKSDSDFPLLEGGKTTEGLTKANAKNFVASSGKFDLANLLVAGSLADMSIGDKKAPVTIIEYASITCFHCARFEEAVFPALKKKYIDTGKVRFIFREFPFDPRAEAGFMLARCSKDNYFSVLNALFRQHEKLVTSQNIKQTLLEFARQAGFSEKSFKECLSDSKLLENMRSGRFRAEKEFKITSTPTFFIQEEKYSGMLSIEEISSIIESKL